MEDLSLSTLIWLRMARFVQNSNQLSNEHLRRFGLTVAQFEALAHIRNFEPITQSELAEGLTVSGGGISRMLARLESEGLISREQDWKTKHISLTAKGRELLERAFPSQQRQQASLFDDSLSEDEKVQLHALMKKLYDTSRKRGENPQE
ncbi:DNA-binding transcriptional regulator, MarR family [Brevibacterium iodinum ATCC 49514]|uniref:DNA-binding transcriptional regulator, MarR family n=1 Tax=Brevibacterium iodinum ATCC 49514 TaxID=1255616 RepID=A0A2H1HRT0_9MICO|nr:MarR family transcriptional regulator [Brevibacterium iodinum]SMX65622.1 DNA-binding transcriptional regulator, MarR family [Brevibacterium iodinum ATCC 49514]SUW13469.1 Multiple antibiotic resistance protein marR [Brevibacterium iodinum]